MRLGAFRRAMDAIAQRAAAAIVQLVIEILSSSTDKTEARRQLVPLLTSEIRGRRREAHDLAIEFLRSRATSDGVADPYLPTMNGYPEDAVDSVLREYMQGSPQEAAQSVAQPLVRHVEDSARQVIVRAVEDDEATEGEEVPATSAPRRPVAWARVLTGAENCEFCVMLASRGAIYGDAESAGQIPASLKWADAKGFINRYHDNCDCIVVPVYNRADWPGREQSVALYDLWRRATKGFSGQDAMNALARELSRMQREGESLPVEDLRAAA